MVRQYGFFTLLLIIGSFALKAQVSNDRKVLTEKEKIECLIQSVESLDGAKFIRNGTEYDASAAASHLRLKLNKAGSRIKTVHDFIDLIASKSSVSGKPYYIRLKTGEITSTADFFNRKLRDL